MVIADILNITNIGSITATSGGAPINTSRLTRKSFFISALTNGSGTGAGSQLFVDIEGSFNGSHWFTLDNVRYESGTATQKDVFSYNSYIPYMRSFAIGSNVATFNVSTVLTGRGI